MSFEHFRAQFEDRGDNLTLLLHREPKTTLDSTRVISFSGFGNA